MSKCRKISYYVVLCGLLICLSGVLAACIQTVWNFIAVTFGMYCVNYWQSLLITIICVGIYSVRHYKEWFNVNGITNVEDEETAIIDVTKKSDKVIIINSVKEDNKTLNEDALSILDTKSLNNNAVNTETETETVKETTESIVKDCAVNTEEIKEVKKPNKKKSKKKIKNDIKTTDI